MKDIFSKIKEELISCKDPEASSTDYSDGQDSVIERMLTVIKDLEK